MSKIFTIYIDGDALPNLLKPVLFRTIEKLNIQTFVVSNKIVTLGKSKNIQYLVVEAGADEADNKIVELIQESDLAITADIPLADRVISKNAHAIDHRGELYSVDNVKHCLAMRNLMQSLRESGEITKGPPPFTQKDVEKFANQLNMFMQKYKKI